MVRKEATALLACVCLAGGLAVHSAMGQEAKSAQAAHPAPISADQLKWGPGPPGLPPGSQAAILDGDPGKPGMFAIRAKFPDGYQVPPHWHPTDEHVTVISGTLLVGMGPKLDEASLRSLGTGGYVKMPAKMHHTAKAKGETIVQIQAMGPFQITYVNPADDPRKKSSTTSK